jgi:cobalt-zinc-cadmium efflux system protein
MGHSHGHGHTHGPVHGRRTARDSAAESDRRWLVAALTVLALFTLGEAAAGLIVGSLALLSDAGHLLTDVAALALAVFTSRFSRRPARGVFTYGFTRVDALSGQANGITLILLALWFGVSSIRRLIHPTLVSGPTVTAVALVGVLVNLLVAWLASRADRRGLNVRGVLVHLFTDLWAFGVTAAAGAVIWATGWLRADAVASAVIALLMIRSGAGLVRESARVFLEGAPIGMEPDVVGDAMAAVSGVAEVHDLHVWDLGSGEAALSAHVAVQPDFDCHQVADAVRGLLADQHDIFHATLQADHHHGEDGPGSAADCADTHGPGYTASNRVSR